MNWLLDRGPRYWPRWIGPDGRETPVWVDIDRGTGEHSLMGSGLSAPLPQGFVGMDAAGASIVVRVKSGTEYRLIGVDSTTGALTTLTMSSKPLSLPAVARGHAAYLRREGNVERIELVDVATGEITVIAERTGKPFWGKGQIVDGRPLDYDGRRVVFAAGRRVYAVAAEKPAPGAAPGVAAEGLLAFERFSELRDRSPSLVVASADGSSELTIGRVDNALGPPNFSWSPDGSRLVFARKRNLYISNADGSSTIQLTNATARDSAPRWSPDGTRILFERSSKGRASLRTISPSGANHQNLTKGMDDARSASWSPDGTRIAFLVNEFRPTRSHMYVVAADGTDRLRVAMSKAGNRFSTYQRLSWSSDGARIAFATFGGSANIVSLNADGTGAVGTLVDTNRANATPTYSSTGQLAFVSNRNGNAELYHANGDGTAESRLTTSPGTETAPAWSPDGALIAYRVTHLTRTSELYLIPADGSSGPTRLTAPAGSIGPRPSGSRRPEQRSVAEQTLGRLSYVCLGLIDGCYVPCVRRVASCR